MMKDGDYMHSRVFEISRIPIEKESRLDAYELPDWFCSGIADYVDNIHESYREDDLKWFAGRFGENCQRDGDQVSFNDQVKMEYFRGEYEKFRAAAAILVSSTLEEFCGNAPKTDIDRTVYRLKSAYEDKFGFYVYDRDDEELITMDAWVRRSDLTVPYFIGGIVDYHW